ncbi:hypothetical protein AKJ61_02975 [candidate division MSBL1 archaeon SCGC-AAA259B11]|uniref:Uncharacterized protein n=1 Tax=candidate division MSBL1 archaeon SCGC-AAA259B11 TaxID=1698260 RepID=A0A133U5D2_9EURY|nr:hypothetical protein AKJ61_02975 [candidate division MSBL1 archaeon SCGC-AAA259B11]
MVSQEELDRVAERDAEKFADKMEKSQNPVPKFRPVLRDGRLGPFPGLPFWHRGERGRNPRATSIHDVL